MGINLCLPSYNCYDENMKPDPRWLEAHKDFYPDIEQINDVALVIGFGLITSRAARRIKNLFQNALFQVVNLWNHDLISERTLGYSVQKFRTQSVFLEKDCKEAHIMTSVGSNAFEYFHQALINCNTSNEKHFKIFPIPADKYFNLSAPTAKQNGLVHILSFLEEHETEDLTGLLYLAKVMAEVTECFVKMFSKPPKWKVLGVPPAKESAIQKRLETHRKLEVTCCPITSLKQFEYELQSSHLLLLPPKSVNTLDLALTSMAIGVPVVAPSGSPCHNFVEEFMEEFETDLVVDMNGDITELRKKIIYTVRKHGAVCRKMELIKNILKGVVPKLQEANRMFAKCVAEHLKKLYQGQYDCQNLRFLLPGHISQEAEDSSSDSDDSQTNELSVKLGINGAIPVKGKSIKDVERALFRRKIQKKIKSLTAKLKTVRKHSSKKIAKIEAKLEKLHEDLEFIDDTPSSISFIMKCKSLEALECLMSEYSSGRLLKMMEEELLTPEFMKRIGVLYLSLQVLIDMEEYKLCRSELLALNGK
ncbi:uncharacterized protein [Ptychodera flava]|uniref:uncharacterized protein n=1 Tax=Ptychodera flava TaxID=63121 RepID=UPI00396A6004